MSSEPIALTSPQVRIDSLRTNPGSNYVSTADTVAKMISISKDYSLSPLITHVTQSALSHLSNQPQSAWRGYSSLDMIRSIFWWVKGHVTFQEDDSIMAGMFGIDPYVNGGRDFLITPDLLLSMDIPTGDCDDFSMLVAAMAINAGFVREFGRGWFVTIAADESDPSAFTHVYTKWFCPDVRPNPYIYIDASHGKFPGWESPKMFRKQEWEIL